MNVKAGNISAFARPADLQIATTSSAMRNSGYLLSGVLVLFLIFDIAIKFLGLPVVFETMAQLGYPGTAGMANTLAVILLVCTVLYVIPGTSVLGAVLLTGYLGGAVATHVRIGSPLFSHILFGVYLGVFAWGGLFLRDARLRALFAWRR